MSANVGDRIRMLANHTDVPDRTGTIVAVLGTDGPPYRVRFDTGEETIVTPGPDAIIEPPSTGERVEQIAEAAGEAVGQAAETAKETAEKVTGQAARAVSDVADDVARRLGGK